MPDGSVLTVYTFLDPVTGTFPQGNSANSMVQGSDGNFYVTLLTAPLPTTQNPGTQGAIGRFTPGGGFTVIHPLNSDGSEGDGPIGPLTEGPDGAFYGITERPQP